MIVQRFLQWMARAPAGKRAEATSALARAYLFSAVDEDTRSAMEAAMTIVLDDSSPEVRMALADGLAAGLESPRHVILTLATDRPAIAARVLAVSPLFIDAELVDIAAGAEAALQVAVAARPQVSNAVSAALAEVGDRDACLRLVGNAGAAIARISFRRMAERFGDDAEIRAAMLERPGLPPDVRQMLVRRLSIALGDLVAAKAWVADGRAQALTRDACEKATVAIAAETETEELGALVEHLRVTGQLNTALLLRAVCAGNVALFESALAVLARVPAARVASLMRAGKRQGLRAVYDKAGLPAKAFDAFVAAIDTCRAMAEEGGPRDRYRFTLHMVEQVLARYREITDGEANELATMLRRFAADQARDAARDYARTALVA